MLLRTLKWCGLIAIPVFIYMARISVYWLEFLSTPIVPPSSPPVVYVLKPHTSVNDFAQDLHQMGLLKHPIYLTILARLSGHASHLRAGEYQIMPGTHPSELLLQIRRGRVLIRKITLIEGWTFKDVLAAIAREPHLTHTLNTTDPAAVMTALGFRSLHPEGLFFPDTYRFTLGVTDKTLLLEAKNLMDVRLKSLWDKRAKNVNYKNSYEALIVASLVEKEAHAAEDRAKIAGVILKRLQKNMPLQIDAAVIYGMGAQYHGVIHKTDLTQDTPYNTYIHKGLPPTPIAMPGIKSIQAALHPELSNDLFFVVKGDGKHQFSSTLKEHNAAVREYRTRSASDTNHKIKQDPRS